MLQAEGWKIEPEDLAEVSPYLTEPIMRFGEYSTHELAITPEAYEPRLDIDFTQLHDGPAASGQNGLVTANLSLTLEGRYNGPAGPAIPPPSLPM
ncbi:hypothetical protein [Nonomuraea angiospora]